MEIVESFNNLGLGTRAIYWPPSISKFDDYTCHGAAIRFSQPLKDAVIPQPFKDFGLSYIGGLIAVVEKADH